jgi:hypothetical protein
MRRTGTRRSASALCLSALAGLTAGCYAYIPPSTTPAPGTVVALDLNDRGRVALGDSIGASADRIEGLLESSSDSSYVLRVKSVRYTNGETNRWTNEPLSVRTDLVRHLTERRLSRQRTMIAVGGTAALVLGFALTRDIFGIGGPEPRPPGGEPGEVDQ